MEDGQREKKARGAGKGSSFFALDPAVWAKLWTIPTANRLNLIIAHLVLLAGTGSDHRLTKWSAKACEEHTGLGKPRAKHAIEELIAAKLVQRTATSTMMMPQYELPALPADTRPIFLPNALVTGLGGEASMLRRVRETGDALALKMLVDLYGLIELDATHGVAINAARGGGTQKDDPTARKVSETGAHAVWAITRGTYRSVSGDWTAVHRVKASDNTVAWKAFWQRFDLLKQIGAIWYEPWLFDGEALDAEPLMPLDLAGYYGVAEPDDEAKLTRLAFEASYALIGEERSYLFDRNAADFYVPLTAHRQTPAYREVLRLRVEADTPGRRLSWKRRRTLIEQQTAAYQALLEEVGAGTFNKPLRTATARAF